VQQKIANDKLENDLKEQKRLQDEVKKAEDENRAALDELKKQETEYHGKKKSTILLQKVLIVHYQLSKKTKPPMNCNN